MDIFIKVEHIHFSLRFCREIKINNKFFNSKKLNICTIHNITLQQLYRNVSNRIRFTVMCSSKLLLRRMKFHTQLITKQLSTSVHLFRCTKTNVTPSQISIALSPIRKTLRSRQYTPFVSFSSISMRKWTEWNKPILKLVNKINSVSLTVGLKKRK